MYNILPNSKIVKKLSLNPYSMYEYEYQVNITFEGIKYSLVSKEITSVILTINDNNRGRKILRWVLNNAVTGHQSRYLNFKKVLRL